MPASRFPMSFSVGSVVVSRAAARIALLGVLAGPAAVSAQSSAPDAAVAIVEALVRGDSAEATPASYLGSLEKLIEVAADEDWKRDLKSALGVVRKAQTWADIAAEETDRLFETVRRYRSHPVRMAPLVMLLHQVAPDRPDVRFAVLDTFSAPSRIRDLGAAAGAARFLLNNDWNDESATSLASIWRYAGCTHDILVGAQSAAELVRYLKVVYSILEGRQPIRRLTPAERERLRTLGRLRQARMYGDYKQSVEILEAMRKAEPGQPAYALLLGQTYASLDPQMKFKASDARKSLKAFLDATEDTAAEWPSAEMHWLLGFLGVEQRSIDGWRRRAASLRKKMSGARPERQLISPDRKGLGAQIKKWQKQLDKAAKALAEQQALTDKTAERVRVAEGRLADAKRRARGDRRFVARVANASERLSDAKGALRRSERRLARKRQSRDEAAEVLGAGQERMARLADPEK